MNKVVFFNHWHNGDIHVSRGMVKLIMNKVQQLNPSMTFEYSHRNAPDLLSDIPNLGFNAYDVAWLDPRSGVTIKDDTVYINTWYDQQNQKFARQYGILTIDALFASLDEACQTIWGFHLQDVSDNIVDYFPSIDYSKFEIGHATQWLRDNLGTKILVESGQVFSGQAHNFPITPVIIELAKQHPDKTFILSQQENCKLPDNVITTFDIIKKSGTDLNEISFLSTHCDIIIGKASGIFTFSLVKENLFERQMKFICFSHLLSHQTKYWVGNLLHNLVNYSSNFIIDKTQNTNEVFNIIKGQL